LDGKIDTKRLSWPPHSSYLPSNISSDSGGDDWEGRDPEFQVLIEISSVDFDYIEMLKIEHG